MLPSPETRVAEYDRGQDDRAATVRLSLDRAYVRGCRWHRDGTYSGLAEPPRPSCPGGYGCRTPLEGGVAAFQSVDAKEGCMHRVKRGTVGGVPRREATYLGSDERDL